MSTNKSLLNKLESSALHSFVNEHITVLFLRVAAGAFILTHGIPKIIKVLTGDFQFADPLGIGAGISLILSAFAEGVCGLMVLLGLGTRIASFFLIINMAVAGFIFHADDPFSGKEKALLFLIIFIVMALFGGGKYSLDHKFFNE
ncbi:MAG: DoxX family protein [Balneolaceae bacterium]|nr:DoxX family protein [Balneolaceae bacterium]